MLATTVYAPRAFAVVDAGVKLVAAVVPMATPPRCTSYVVAPGTAFQVRRKAPFNR